MRRVAWVVMLLSLSACIGPWARKADTPPPPIEPTPPPSPSDGPRIAVAVQPQRPYGQPEFAGRWVNRENGAVVELSVTAYYRRFQFNGGTRENFGRVVRFDEASRHVEIANTHSLQDGNATPVPSERSFLTYKIENGALHVYVSPKGWGDEPQSEAYYRE